MIDQINRTDRSNQSNLIELIDRINRSQSKPINQKNIKYSIDFDRPIDQFDRPINISIEFDRFDNSVRLVSIEFDRFDRSVQLIRSISLIDSIDQFD